MLHNHKKINSNNNNIKYQKKSKGQLFIFIIKKTMFAINQRDDCKY